MTSMKEQLDAMRDERDMWRGRYQREIDGQEQVARRIEKMQAEVDAAMAPHFKDEAIATLRAKLFEQDEVIADLRTELGGLRTKVATLQNLMGHGFTT